MVPLIIKRNNSHYNSLITYQFPNNTMMNMSTCKNNCSAQGGQGLNVILDAFSWVLVGLYSLTFLIGLIGNALVCFAVWRNKNMRTVTNIFLVNLAAADLGVIIICLPPALVTDITNSWFLGTVFCKIHLFLSVSIPKWFLRSISKQFGKLS